MLIPSIDLMGGRVVQLVHGEDLALGFDDLGYWIDRFSEYPLVQLIDLDAAKRQGDNRRLIETIVHRLPCQVGGGIRSSAEAQILLDMGARRVIFGSSLFHGRVAPESIDRENSPAVSNLVRTQFAEELAFSLGVEQLVFSVDTKDSKVAVRGWKEKIELRPQDAMQQLEPFCGAFLYTHVDTEGTLSGFPMEIARNLRRQTRRQLIVAGGIRAQSEIDELDAENIDAVAGMAIYTGLMKA
ncbi:MAG: HisA/HisF-related TIM barrel protein [Acidobacteriaceae bacterium]|jgi:phosphoribosylformimino-5-aminoimidazole carboxamide ribotide isomerase